MSMMCVYEQVTILWSTGCPQKKWSVGIWIYSGGHHDLYQCKPLISPSNVALNSNPGTVLKSARPEDSKTPPTC